MFRLILSSGAYSCALKRKDLATFTVLSCLLTKMDSAGLRLVFILL